MKILCAIDGSDHAAKALDLAAELARNRKASLRLMHVVQRDLSGGELERFAKLEGLSTDAREEFRSAWNSYGLAPPMPSPERERSVATPALAELCEQLLASARLACAEVDDVDTWCAWGNPAERILEYAESEQVDMVVLGNRGLGKIKSFMLGSVSQRVASRAACTCVLVK